MATETLKAKLFWYEGEGIRKCTVCQVQVEGKLFHPMIQHGEATELNFKEIEPVICQSCYIKFLENK